MVVVIVFQSITFSPSVFPGSSVSPSQLRESVVGESISPVGPPGLSKPCFLCPFGL